MQTATNIVLLHYVKGYLYINFVIKDMYLYYKIYHDGATHQRLSSTYISYTVHCGVN